MFKRRIDTNFVSDIDRFLIDYDKHHHGRSNSQRKEIKKHQKIFEKRDSTK